MLEIFPKKQNGTHAQRVVEGAIVPSIQREGAAAVVISKERNSSIRPGDMHQEMQHRSDLVTDDRWKHNLVLFGENERLEVEIECVAVVVGRKLAINSVAQDL